MRKYQLTFKVSRSSDNIDSNGTGHITAENFDEMAEEIERWLVEGGGKCEILEAEWMPDTPEDKQD